jgi:hypothetical protein
MPEGELRLRIVVIHPPAHVPFAVQRGRSELVAPSRQTATELVFDLSVRVAEGKRGEPNFLGPFAQGPVGGRFIYVNSGKRVGDQASPWDRRAKVQLRDIGWPLVKKALSTDAALEARIEGTSRDGGPACATVSLLGEGWRVAG